MKRTLWLAGLLSLSGAVAVAQDAGPSAVPSGDFSAAEWLNTDGRTSVADFKGEVVLVEHFATW